MNSLVFLLEGLVLRLPRRVGDVGQGILVDKRAVVVPPVPPPAAGRSRVLLGGSQQQDGVVEVDLDAPHCKKDFRGEKKGGTSKSRKQEKTGRVKPASAESALDSVSIHSSHPMCVPRPGRNVLRLSG